MRRILVALAAVATLVAGVALGALGAGSLRQTVEIEYRGITIRVDGKAVQSDAEPFILVEKGRTYVPARALAESLGARVVWEDAASTVQVYTPRHVESRTQGEWTTWSLPGRGVSFRAPASLMRRPSGNVDLHLEGPAGLVMLVRMPPDPAALSVVAEAVWQAFSARLGSGKVLGTGEVTMAGRPGYQITAEHTVHGAAMLSKMSLVRTDGEVWILVTMHAREPRPGVPEAMDAVFDSFAIQAGG